MKAYGIGGRFDIYFPVNTLTVSYSHELYLVIKDVKSDWFDVRESRKDYSSESTVLPRVTLKALLLRLTDWHLYQEQVLICDCV